jgi:hypothetical protein
MENIYENFDDRNRNIFANGRAQFIQGAEAQ